MNKILTVHTFISTAFAAAAAFDNSRWNQFGEFHIFIPNPSISLILVLFQSSLLHELNCHLPATALEFITTIVLAIASTSAEIVFRFDVNVLQIMIRNIIEVQMNFLTSYSDRNLFFATRQILRENFHNQFINWIEFFLRFFR